MCTYICPPTFFQATMVLGPCVPKFEVIWSVMSAIWTILQAEAQGVWLLVSHWYLNTLPCMASRAIGFGLHYKIDVGVSDEEASPWLGLSSGEPYRTEGEYATRGPRNNLAQHWLKVGPNTGQRRNMAQMDQVTNTGPTLITGRSQFCHHH